MNTYFPSQASLAQNNIDPLPFEKDRSPLYIPQDLIRFADDLNPALFVKPNPMDDASDVHNDAHLQRQLQDVTRQRDAAQRKVDETQRQLQEMTRQRDQALARNQQLVNDLSQMQTTLDQEREMHTTQVQQAIQQEQQRHEQHMKSLVISTLPPNSTIFPKQLQKTEHGNVRNYIVGGQQGELGRGGYGIVVRTCPVTDRVRQYALKVVPSDDESNTKELFILQQVHHPNIIKLQDSVYDESNNTLGMVLELGAMDLMEYMNQYGDDGQYLSIDDRQEVARALVKATNYLHNSKEIAHLDIKPENIIITNVSSRPLRQEYIKLCDFGLALAGKPLIEHKMRGTTCYFAPEMIGPIHHYYCCKAADIWSIGVTLLEIHVNLQQEWQDAYSSLHDDYQNFHQGIDNMLRQYSRVFIDSGMNLAMHMLQMDPACRITAQQALQHPWIIEVINNE